jgi:cAMP-dependent protein kinase regulator
MAQSSEGQQEYIQQKVNPILENLVTQLLLERPENLAPFMIKWLTEHAKTPAAAALTEGVNELEELKAELKKLQAEVEVLEAEVGDRSGQQEADSDEEDEDDDDDDDDAPDVMPPVEYLKKNRASVSAEAYGMWNIVKEFVPPVHAKTEEQKGRIKKVLSRSFLFSSLETSALQTIVDAMQEKIVEEGDKLITQGDDGDCLYVVEEGQMDCFKKQADGAEKKVKECTVGDAFGELALLYNCPRAASVVAHAKGVLWQLDRESFNHVVRDAAVKRRERYEEFLKGVPLLKSMEGYERSQLCDALRVETIAEGTKIVTQGEAGNDFYILEEGSCDVEKVYVEGTPATKVMSYQSGDCFGELALLRNEPRAATVVAKSECRLLAIDRKTFKSLLGPMEDILKRNASQYA